MLARLCLTIPPTNIPKMECHSYCACEPLDTWLTPLVNTNLKVAYLWYRFALALQSSYSHRTQSLSSISVGLSRRLVPRCGQPNKLSLGLENSASPELYYCAGKFLERFRFATLAHLNRSPFRLKTREMRSVKIPLGASNGKWHTIGHGTCYPTAVWLTTNHQPLIIAFRLTTLHNSSIIWRKWRRSAKESTNSWNPDDQYFARGKGFFSQPNTVTKHKLFLLYLFCTYFIHIHNAGNPRR